MPKRTAESSATSLPDPAWFTVFNEIGIISQLSSVVFARVLPEGLSLAGFNVLNHLTRLPGDWGPARLAAAFQVTKGAMTNTLQRLETAGYVRLEADPNDGRAKFVRLTTAGKRARDKSIAQLTPALAKVEQALGPAPARATLPFLRSLRMWLDENR